MTTRIDDVRDDIGLQAGRSYIMISMRELSRPAAWQEKGTGSPWQALIHVLRCVHIAVIAQELKNGEHSQVDLHATRVRQGHEA